jgi:hypothetical protein
MRWRERALEILDQTLLHAIARAAGASQSPA